MRNIIDKFKHQLVWSLLIMSLMLISSLILRQQDSNKLAGAQILEATYHVLLTVTALGEIAADKHWYLACQHHLVWVPTYRLRIL